MSPRQVTLRTANSEDAAALIALWEESIAPSTERGGQVPGLPVTVSVADAAGAISTALERPNSRLIVALVGGEIVGSAYFELRNACPVLPTKVLVITDFLVTQAHRRKGVASAMLTAAALYADEHNAAVVSAAVKSHHRETHRFLTKLGFVQASVIRAIPAEMLRPRLAIKTTGSRDTSRLLAVRRGMRRREGLDHVQ